ncbi:DUF134 domain-containing protein [Poseidonibacter lekithochrous]|uniref:DUF134 domain-containing protein n=1 Tax=Poseidonibacter TaxID=2321187 RepID=UPI001C09DB2B|nr:MULTISPECIES: DUF134 domain-containing protein [Poseidonibacter]MBU3013869.1 DUF134 domain-containing protein [Poseidonibacter lekithochrous]MDO6827163.1 DUF134 domain-containing protein [Poseidonibacter sp. 1_MG-2023]
MGREKTKRNLVFKPAFKDYIPENKSYNGITHLLDEEMEAIYLMDILDLYQEKAAESMKVSRPTFTRILKNARQKLTRAIVYGNKISIEDANTPYIVAICSASKNSFESMLSTDQYISIYKIEDNEVTLIKSIENDVYVKTSKPAIVLPQIFLDFNVNIFLSTKIGEGLKNSLLTKGIQVIEKQITNKEDLINL